MNRHYQVVLRKIYDERKGRNPYYSLRSFARDLSLSPASLSRLFSARQGLSPSRARQLADLLQLKESQRMIFIDSATAQHSRSETERKKATRRLAERERAEKPILEDDSFRVISDWYHVAILELTYLETFQSEPRWIAERLGIPENDAIDAIERLLAMGLLKKEGNRLVDVRGYMTAGGGSQPSEPIRHFHRQIIGKALRSVDDQSIVERDLSATVISVSTEDLPEMRKFIQSFRRKFSVRITDSKRPPNAVYALSVQLFNLSNLGDFK